MSNTTAPIVRNSIQESISRLILPLNISIGFLGIQFAWAIQMGQMSPLLEKLGSVAWLTSLIWAAGPVTGVMVQPIVGKLSDNFRSRFGRRRPFLLTGAVLTALALIIMPNSPFLGQALNDILPIQFNYGLLIAALMLWVLDASINITQGPYRALVPDVVDKERQTTAYSMMSFTIGLGAVAAFLIAYKIDAMHNLFYLGAIAMLVAIGWTAFTTPEPSSLEMEIDDTDKNTGFLSLLAAPFTSIRSMPAEGLKLCFAHSFTWFGLMCLFVFFSVFVPKQVFGAVGADTPLYTEGVQWASLCYATFNIVCFMFSPLIGRLCHLFGKKAVHTAALLLMAASYLALYFMTGKEQVMIAMAFIGIGWATTLSIPFALLSDHLPKGKEGVLMGTFNIFIAAPGVLCSFLVGPIISVLGGNDAIAFLIGGASILVSALLMQRVTEDRSVMAEESALT